MAEFSDLLGKTLVRAENINDAEILFETDDGETFRQYHVQSCCEDVTVEDIIGDLSDLVGAPITMAEEVVHVDEDPPEVKVSGEDARGRESFTWTFYKLATRKGYVTIRWLGESNGCYSESVDFARVAA